MRRSGSEEIGSPRSHIGRGRGSLFHGAKQKSLHFFGELPSGGLGLSNAKIARLLLPGAPNGFFGRDTRSCLREQVSYPAPIIRRVANLRTQLGNSLRRSREKNVAHYKIYRAATIPHAIKLNAMLVKKASCVCINFSYRDSDH